MRRNKRSCENNFGKVSSINHSYLFGIGYVTCCINTPKPPEIPIPVSKMHSQCKYVIRSIQINFLSRWKSEKTKSSIKWWRSRRSQYTERSIPISSYLHWTRCLCPPDKGVVQRTTNELKIDEQQVSYRCLPFSLLATTWLSTSRYHPALILWEFSFACRLTSHTAFALSW